MPGLESAPWGCSFRVKDVSRLGMLCQNWIEELLGFRPGLFGVDDEEGGD